MAKGGSPGGRAATFPAWPPPRRTQQESRVTSNLQAARNQRQGKPEQRAEDAPVGIRAAIAQVTLRANDIGVNIVLATQQMLEHAIEGKIELVGAGRAPQGEPVGQHGRVSQHCEGEQARADRALIE